LFGPEFPLRALLKQGGECGLVWRLGRRCDVGVGIGVGVGPALVISECCFERGKDWAPMRICGYRTSGSETSVAPSGLGV